MATLRDGQERPEHYRRFEHPVPAWFTDAKLGIFVHWGPYSVPAWAEPIGELGTIDPAYWYAHNPYAEWYFNTVRIDGSPAQQHQEETYGGAPYDDFLDHWHPDLFDPDELLRLVASTGAGYFVPTTKHHDGVALWQAPGTGDRNTVDRGPRRDLVADFAAATRAVGLRFGVYYSGGLDWHFSQLPPVVGEEKPRPVDLDYAAYAHHHVQDLIDRFTPDILWGDIDWPDAGKPAGPVSLENVFAEFYRRVPDGVVNDRWGLTHWDFRTSEYQHDLGVEGRDAWENCRGIGFSFGYNQLEDSGHLMSGPAAVRHFVDVVSRGGNLLLNIGLRGDGTVPQEQRETLEHLASWNDANGDAIFGSTPFTEAAASEEPWVRWTRTGTTAHAFVDGIDDVALLEIPETVDAASARVDGRTAEVTPEGTAVRVTLPTRLLAGPRRITFDLTTAEQA